MIKSVQICVSRMRVILPPGLFRCIFSGYDPVHDLLHDRIDHDRAVRGYLLPGSERVDAHGGEWKHYQRLNCEIANY